MVIKKVNLDIVIGVTSQVPETDLPEVAFDTAKGIKFYSKLDFDILAVPTTAGTGAERTSDLIPMCHILPITKCKVEFEMVESELAIYCNCTVRVTGKTGVEMEALTGASVALLTVYDMCKAMDKKMEIGEIYLVRKSGGKSGLIDNGYKKERKEGEK